MLKNQSKDEKKNSSSTQVYPVDFLEKELFFKAIAKTKKEDGKTVYKKVYGGVIPHHLLASELIADFFALLPKDSETVILLGPNHFEEGKFAVLTSDYAWETPFGVIDADWGTVDVLKQDKLAQIDNEVVSQEHAIVGILPFLKYYLPETKVVPLIFSRRFSEGESRRLAKRLADLPGKKLILSSLDFSHYLSFDEAEIKDRETQKAMKEFNYSEIFAFQNDHLDSPPALAVLLMTMEEIKQKNFQILEHANSSRFSQEVRAPMTSYFTLVFGQ